MPNDKASEQKSKKLSELTPLFKSWLDQKSPGKVELKVAGRFVQFGPDPTTAAIRENAAVMIRHNRRIADNVRKHAAFYLGEEDAPMPGADELVEHQIDPKKNNACTYLSDFGRAVTKRLPGEYNVFEVEAIALLRDSVTGLIANTLELVLRSGALNASSTVVADFFGYLLRTNPTLTYAQHEANVNEHIARLQRRFCKNADSFYDRTTELLNAARERERAARKAKPMRRAKKPLGMGRQTPFMKEQRRIFEAFLRDNPVTGSYSVITRANQCWLRHKEEWDAAAADGTGYSCHKALARAV